jgi:hypothetical protein
LTYLINGCIIEIEKKIQKRRSKMPIKEVNLLDEMLGYFKGHSRVGFASIKGALERDGIKFTKIDLAKAVKEGIHKGVIRIEDISAEDEDYEPVILSLSFPKE